jgi:Fe-S cluster assembly protein SufB/Fe-S cluster assembly protein SufD
MSWWIMIWKKVNNSEWNLLQKNIILGKNTKIQITPGLDINSNNIIASHWAKIEYIDKNKLFYTMSRWLSNEDSTNMIIKWYINNIFTIFENTKQIETIKNDIFETIRQ